MQELVNIVTSKLGINSELASKAIGIILNMLKREGPSDKVGELLTALPGAEDLMSEVGSGGTGSGGGLGGLISGALGGSGALMETLSELQSEGLDLDQSRSIGLEVLAFAKEKAGEELVKEIADSIPGLSQLI